MATSPTPPGTPPPSDPSAAAGVYDANQLAMVQQGSERLKDISQILRQVKENYSSVLAESKKLTDSITEQTQEINKLAAAAGSNLSEKLTLYSRNLKIAIDDTEKYSTSLKVELNQSIKDSIDLQRQLDKLRNDSVEIQKVKNESEIEYADVLSEVNKYTEHRKHIEDDVKKILEQLNQVKSDGNQIDEQTIKSIIQKNNISEKNTYLQGKILDLGRQINIINDKSHEQQKNELEKTINIINKKKERLALEISLKDVEQMRQKHTEKVNESMDGLLSRLTGTTTQTNLMTSAVISMSGGIKNLGTSVLTGLAESFLKPEQAMNRFFNFLHENLIKSTFEYDKMLTQINRQTGGFGREFERAATKTSAGLFTASAVGNLGSYGVGLKEVGEAYTALNNKIGNFNNLSDNQRKILATNAATMNNLGVSAETYASLTSKFMGSLGNTAEGATKQIDRLAGDAIAAGKNVGQYAQEFAQLSSKITGYGKEAIAVFKELNGIAAATKGVLTAGDIADIGDRFSNWDEAAEGVSKLNAALGGTSINIEEMMRADPSERVMKIRQAFAESGQDFDKLNIGYKRLLAESMGLGNDVEKAGALLKADMSEMQQMMYKTAASEEEIAKRKKESVEATQKITKAVEGMKIALTPIISMIGLLADGISLLNDKIGGFGTFLVASITLAVPMMIGGWKLFTSAATWSFNKVIDGVVSGVERVIMKINQAKTEASTIPKSVPVPGGDGPTGGSAAKDAADALEDIGGGDGGGKKGGKTPGKFGKFMGGLGKIAGIAGTAMAVIGTISSISDAVKGSSSTVAAPEMPKPEESLPSVGAGTIGINTTVKQGMPPKLGVLDSSGKFSGVANLNAKDKITAVAGTPEEISSYNRPSVAPPSVPISSQSNSITNAVSDYNTASTQSVATAINNSFSSQTVQQKKEDTEKLAGLIGKEMQHALRTTKINTNSEITNMPDGAFSIV